ncbi:MAG: hypothetical protein AAFP84_04375 [Actinomycetota bacterium]
MEAIGVMQERAGRMQPADVVAGHFEPVYVVGGRQRRDRSLRELGDGWYGYDTGVILRVAPDGVEVVHEYVSKPGTHQDGDAVLFKSATRVGDRLYCSTQTEVLVYSLPSFDEVAHVSLSHFNDVHHVRPTATGTLLVANSGLETVMEVTLDGELVGEWNVLGEDTWSLHDPALDYRQGVNLKPHRAHPNQVFLLGDEPWATRFELKDAVSVADPSRRIDIGGERVHDGLPTAEGIWFTTVDGEVVLADADSLRVTERHRLTHPDGADTILGWCRGILPTEHTCWVGFSRIRPTRLRHTVSWIRTKGVPQAPTRIARYRRDDWRLVDEIDLEPHGLNAVFSVIPT